jgi:two-component system, sensor histidine kinase and response regulator
MDRPSRIDPSGLARLQEWGGDALVTKMVALFIELTPERMERIEMGVALGTAEEIERGAHSLKSSAANLGAYDLQKILDRIEEHGEKKEVEAVAEILPALRKVYDETLSELKDLSQGARS